MRKKAKAGPSTPLRSGRDDNFVMRFTYILEEKLHFLANELSSRPERSGVEGPALAFFWQGQVSRRRERPVAHRYDGD